MFPILLSGFGSGANLITSSSSSTTSLQFYLLPCFLLRQFSLSFSPAAETSFLFILPPLFIFLSSSLGIGVTVLRTLCTSLFDPFLPSVGRSPIGSSPSSSSNKRGRWRRLFQQICTNFRGGRREGEAIPGDSASLESCQVGGRFTKILSGKLVSSRKVFQHWQISSKSP